MYQKSKKTEEALAAAAGRENVLIGEPLARHTSFRIGGPADYFVTPSNEEQIRAVVRICRENAIPFFVIGNGTNLLVSDTGYRGVILQIYRNFSEIRIEGCTISAQSGALLSSIAQAARKEGLTGLEFASGIPGTIGGAAVMNAGAYGGELKDVVKTVRLLDIANDKTDILTAEEMQFGYRTSIVSKKERIVLGAELELEKGDPQEIQDRMEELRQKRVSKQPLDVPSAGSTFKRPEGYFAGKLIMDSGLAGFRVGGAMVSPKHCGFVVNTGGATAEDVLSLIRQVREKVFREYGVMLEPEIRMLSCGPDEKTGS